MYLHLGKGKIVSTEDIVGIFDLDITSQSHLTRKYLTMAGKGRRGRERQRGYTKVLCRVPVGKQEDTLSEPDGFGDAAEARGVRAVVIVNGGGCPARNGETYV